MTSDEILDAILETIEPAFHVKLHELFETQTIELVTIHDLDPGDADATVFKMMARYLDLD